MENKTMTEANVKRFVEMFNTDFKCNIREERFHFLISMFEDFVNQEISDPSEINAYEMFEDLEEKIKYKLDDEGKKLFNEWVKIQDDYLLDTAEQAFVYGYCVCKQLEYESRIVGGKNE